MPIIIAVGDSITYGNWDHEGGWISWLRKYIDKKNLSVYQGADLYSKYYSLIYNLGIPGDTTEGVLKRLESELKPRVNPELDNLILFAIGINDSRYYERSRTHEVPLNKFRENLTKILKRAKDFTGKIVFVGLTPVDENRTDPIFWEREAFYRNEFIKKYNEELRGFCEREEIYFIEVFEKMSQLDIVSLMEDGIHPNDKGYEFVTGLIINDLLEEQLI